MQSDSEPELWTPEAWVDHQLHKHGMAFRPVSPPTQPWSQETHPPHEDLDTEDFVAWRSANRWGVDWM